MLRLVIVGKPWEGARVRADKQRRSPVLVANLSLWHCHGVKRTLQRWFVGLGVLAMLMALVAIPAGIALASAKSDMAAMAGSPDDMPCNHPCPGCAKPCPDMGSCLLKCFQPLSNAPVQASVQRYGVQDLVPPGPSRRISEAPIPPLLRPPSV
jgi:hypothetical protein